MPLGRPVVPEEYSIGVPRDSSPIGVPGKALVASSKSAKIPSSPVPSTIRPDVSPGQSRAASRATSRHAREVIRSLAVLLLRM
jgi:hypothetical protein